jgi:hypothetical protein
MFIPDPGVKKAPDPGSGSATLDPGWVKYQDPDPGSGYGINIADHIFESLETIFFV